MAVDGRLRLLGGLQEPPGGLVDRLLQGRSFPFSSSFTEELLGFLYVLGAAYAVLAEVVLLGAEDLDSHYEARDEEDHRVRDVAEDAPEHLDGVLRLGGDAALAVAGEVHAAEDDRQHAARADDAVAHGVGPVAGHDGDRDLREGVVQHRPEPRRRHPAAEAPEDRTDEPQAEQRHEHRPGLGHLRVARVLLEGVVEHLEHHDRRPVVQQRLALDQNTQPLRHAELVQQGHHRHRIRRRRDRTEHQRRRPVPVVFDEGVAAEGGGEDGGDDDAGAGEGEDLPLELDEDVGVHVEGRLEDQDGDDGPEEHLRGDVVPVADGPGGLVVILGLDDHPRQPADDHHDHRVGQIREPRRVLPDHRPHREHQHQRHQPEVLESHLPLRRRRLSKRRLLFSPTRASQRRANNGRGA
mmetsp:Transcript_26268/g.84977  ORF Transcript_26268/g.84977 Transcript_26268/m.84977 type:complete len:409 (-) Transcript_26268:105-1331(-)